MCAELPEGPVASRGYQEAWVRALRVCSAKPIAALAFDADAPQRDAASDTRSSAALNELTFTAWVSNGRAIGKTEAYEVTCRASIVVENGSDSGGTVDKCTCEWVVWKSRSDWHDMDRQLRALVPLTHVAFPNDHVVPNALSTLFTTSASRDHKIHASVQAFDGFLQKLLALDTVADYTSNGSKLVLGFLEYDEYVANLPLPLQFTPPPCGIKSRSTVKPVALPPRTTATGDVRRADDEVDADHDTSLDIKARVAKVGRKLLVDAIST
ncbi:hypothetical protein H310_00014 [Aphanomyces invadans]|uniref:PX domain-containing protein n=1 Tax=Aphanomyces invadans TaxID=157072 RepID=A0A024USW1_9STRA|nr:hypothetical protein H310_00014 [Aphanomyces invadans]ETW09404.1 hypothetical protein H310_00014 [Aphanomyces invadans]|eukprot:XP_008860815.1 hypothetical protein H310_00014 [Aphanomyces invadans]